MKRKIKKTSQEKMVRCLEQACDAESFGHHKRAERLFWSALHREGQMRSDINNPKEFAESAGPVHKETIEKRLAKSLVQHIAVPCPSGIRKHILKNLNKAARNRTDKKRAKTARQILKEIEEKDHPAKLKSKDESVKKVSLIKEAETIRKIA